MTEIVFDPHVIYAIALIGVAIAVAFIGLAPGNEDHRR